MSYLMLNHHPSDQHAYYMVVDRLTLTEASVSLPVKVKVLQTTKEKSTKYDLTGQTLLLRSVADDVFLRANAINGGKQHVSENAYVEFE